MVKKFKMISPQYEFTSANTLIFITGVALSGKSTIAPIIAGNIKGCSLQNMDIIRILSQEIDSQKPKNKQSPVLNFGSCDAYKTVGNGLYTPESLIKGFKLYSGAVSSLLKVIIPKLEAQGASDVLFEGVQLTPSIVAPFLKGHNRLIIVTSTKERLRTNARKIFENEPSLLDRYTPEKLLLIQNHLIEQSKKIPGDKVLQVDNSGSYIVAVSKVLQFLKLSGTIKSMVR